MFKKKPILFGLLLLAATLFLAACGNSEADTNADSAADAGPSQAVEIEASNFQFNETEYHVNAGEPVTITLTSAEGGHGINIDEFDVNIAAPGGEATFTPDKPGEYKIYCNVFCGEGHGEMTATLIVE